MRRGFRGEIKVIPDSHWDTETFVLVLFGHNGMAASAFSLSMDRGGTPISISPDLYIGPKQRLCIAGWSWRGWVEQPHRAFSKLTWPDLTAAGGGEYAAGLS
jgi:hypothetical protein